MNSINSLNLFFDESFKRSGIDMMGAISISDKVYELDAFKNLNQKVKSDEVHLHWTEYNGNSYTKMKIIEILCIISNYCSLCKVNIIFKHNNNSGYYNNKDIKEMMYFKFPERIFYGLLREYDTKIKMSPKIFVENASEYHTPEINLKENTIKNLNNLTIYRGLNFQLENDKFIYVDTSKKRNDSQEEIQKAQNREIGIYVIDLLLGVVRTIVENKSNNSKKNEAKNELATELLTYPDFYKMIEKTKLFYWSGKRTLEQVDMQNYLQVYLSNRDEWLIHLTQTSN